MIKLINFIDLTIDEKKMILEWRNNLKIKKWMHSKDNISLESHLNFIQTLKNSPLKNYFLVKSEHEYIGVVSLNGEFLGIYADPNKTRVGDILLNQIIIFAFEKKKLIFLKAEVYKTNNTAKKLYSRFGFQIKKDNGKMLTMELKNENR